MSLIYGIATAGYFSLLITLLPEERRRGEFVPDGPLVFRTVHLILEIGIVLFICTIFYLPSVYLIKPRQPVV